GGAGQQCPPLACHARIVPPGHPSAYDPSGESRLADRLVGTTRGAWNAVQVANTDCEIAVLGAGPYGLSAAAHLKAAGHDVRVIGRTMSFWREQMPAGMLLR